MLKNIILAFAILACLFVAGWLAVKQRDGWGWFLFAGLVLATGLEQGGLSVGDGEDRED